MNNLETSILEFVDTEASHSAGGELSFARDTSDSTFDLGCSRSSSDP